MSEHLVVADGLSKKRDGFELAGVTLHVDSTEFIGLAGVNGVGKSTLLGLLSGLTQPDGGSLRIFGTTYQQDPVRVKQDLAVIFDHSILSGKLTARDYGRVFKTAYVRWSDRRFKHYLDRMELSPTKKIHAYSRSMAVKLHFALALAHSPRLLILDEATSGLDPLIRDELLKEVAGYTHTEKAAAILSSHIFSDIVTVASRVIVLKEGRIKSELRLDGIPGADREKFLVDTLAN